ncbi:MAG: hypothetical protein ACLT9P_06775 [Evtepia gabavorous]
MARTDYYLELQDHGIPSRRRSINRAWSRLHQETGIPLVATNDAHYLRREDAEMQDVLMCIQMGKTVEDPNRMRFETQEFYLSNPSEEMAALFPDWPGGAGEHGQNRGAVQYGLPVRRPPPARVQAARGLHRRGRLLPEAVPRGLCPALSPGAAAEYRKQLAYEMDMIRQMGFVDYFLIVSDFIGYAKSHDIPVGPGRGSAAGSMVAYCLDITDVDPHEILPVL